MGAPFLPAAEVAPSIIEDRNTTRALTSASVATPTPLLLYETAVRRALHIRHHPAATAGHGSNVLFA